MQVMLMGLMSKGEYLIVPKGTKFTGAGKLGLNVHIFWGPIQNEVGPAEIEPSCMNIYIMIKLTPQLTFILKVYFLINWGQRGHAELFNFKTWNFYIYL